MSGRKSKGGSAKARVKNLTKRAVDAAKPEGRRYMIWDAALKGFGLRVEPLGAGGGKPRKTFIVRYRAGGGRAGTLRQTTVGRFGTVTVEEARRKARLLLGAAVAGGDPLGEVKAKRRAGVTVADVADWYLEQATAGRLLGRKGRPLKASTVESDRSRIETHVRPLIGNKPVASLTTASLEEFQADIAAAKAGPRRKGTGKAGRIATGGSTVAARTLGTVSAIFGHAVRKGIIAGNPAKGVRKFAVQRRLARLSLDQVRALGEAMRDSQEHPTALAAIRFLLLTGMRRSEALGGRREALVAEGGLILADSKSGPQTRPIGKAALAPFTPLNRGEQRGWLFPADTGETAFKSVPRVLARVSAKAKLKGISPHTLRHSFASIAADLGYSELTIAGLLGHAAGSVTAGYVHLDISLVAAADRVSGVIARALDGEADAAVVPMNERVARS